MNMTTRILSIAIIMILSGCSKQQDNKESALSSIQQTTVIKSTSSPTGYEVKFCYQNPDAKRIRIKGEWLFSSLADGTMRTSTNATPYEWQNGYTLWGTKDWPVYEMSKDQTTGIWSITLPLPSGTYKYKYYIDGDQTDVNNLTGAIEASDPANPPYHRDAPLSDLKGEDTYSKVYVPYDSFKQNLSRDSSIEAPAKPEDRGTVSFVEVPSNVLDIPVHMAVYLPKGYDPNRAEAYPLLFLLHGGGGTESSWLNNGAANILDNVIAEGKMEPTVVIMPNGSNFSWKRDNIVNSIENEILPYATNHYNVSKDVNRRAMAGLSMGGATVMYTLINRPELFNYYTAMSAPWTKDITLDFSNPILKQKKIFVTAGLYDFVKVEAVLNPESRQAKGGEGSFYSFIFGMNDAGVPFKTQAEEPFGHQWVFWREVLAHISENFLWK